jgi:fructoselysine-6-P-deglycase FrlB-like protein
MSLETARRVLRIEAQAIEGLLARLDDTRSTAPWRFCWQCKGRVVVTGMGKSGLIGQKIAATFSSTGTPSVFLHPAEALHGDLGMVLGGDAVLAISYGGETEEIVGLLATIKRLALPLVTLTGNARSTLARRATWCSTPACAKRLARSILRPRLPRPSRWPWATRWPSLCWIGAASAMMILRRCIPAGGWARSFCARAT